MATVQWRGSDPGPGRASMQPGLEGDRSPGAAAPLEVHVWRFALDVGPELLNEWSARLSVAERARAGRFVRPESARRFVAARGRLREILGACLGAPPAALDLARTNRGKPRLAGDFADSGLEFNLAHTGGRGLLAVCRGAEVGVDLEARRPVDAPLLARRVFSSRERELLERVADDERQRAFFELWTRREALLKCRGEGIWSHAPLRAGRLRALASAAIAEPSWETGDAAPLEVLDLDEGPAHAAALAVAAADLRLVRHE